MGGGGRDRLKGICNVGDVRKTEGQDKKHISQMTEAEKKYLKDKIKSIDRKDITLTRHLTNKRKTIGFKMKNIIEVLNEENVDELIVEYNETPTNGVIDKRVLLRGGKSYNVRFESEKGSFISPANICFVVSLENYRVVTVYWNKTKDSHKTMNWNRYNKDLKIIKES